MWPAANSTLMRLQVWGGCSMRRALTKGGQDFKDLGWEKGRCGRCHQGKRWVHRAGVEQRGGGVTGRSGSSLKPCCPQRAEW